MRHTPHGPPTHLNTMRPSFLPQLKDMAVLCTVSSGRYQETQELTHGVCPRWGEVTDQLSFLTISLDPASRNVSEEPLGTEDPVPFSSHVFITQSPDSALT